MARSKLITAVRLHQRPFFSFSGVRVIGNEFAHRSLGRVLLFAARHGHPVAAVNLNRDVSEGLHEVFREIGVLLPDHDRENLLGASENLMLVFHELRRGRGTSLATAIGASEIAAEAQLAVLRGWGLVELHRRWGNESYVAA